MDRAIKYMCEILFSLLALLSSIVASVFWPIIYSIFNPNIGYHHSTSLRKFVQNSNYIIIFSKHYISLSDDLLKSRKIYTSTWIVYKLLLID